MRSAEGPHSLARRGRLLPAEPEIAMRGAASERLRSLQMDAAQLIGCEIESADVRQDVAVAVARRELAEPARTIIHAELERVARHRLDKVIDEITWIHLQVALLGLAADEFPIVVRHELPPRFHPLRLRDGEEMPLEALQLDLLDQRIAHAAP